MATAENQELVDRFAQFYRRYYSDEVGELARKYPSEQRSLHVDWTDLYRFDPDLAEDFLSQPEQLLAYAEEALRLYDLPVDVSLGQAHVRVRDLAETTDIRDIRARHVNKLVNVQGMVQKATSVRPKIEQAAFECQRCGTLTYIPQTGGKFQEPHQCEGCERQGPFQINFDQSEFVDSQKLRVQESPEGLSGGETPQGIDVHVEDDLTGRVVPGDHVSVTGVLHLDQQRSGGEKTAIFDVYMDGLSVTVEDEQFEEMDITDEDKKQILELSESDDIYGLMVDSIAPSIYGYESAKLSIILQLFSGVTKFLPDGSRTRGDLHMLLIGDPGTGKSAILQYIRNIAPRSVYTSGKGSSSAGLTAAAVRDDFAEGQQWTLEAGALVLADQGIAAVDELDKMRCVTGDTLVHLGDGRVTRIRELAHETEASGAIEELPNGRTIRDVDVEAWTMTDDGRLVTRPVTAIHEYDSPGNLTEVALESGETLTSTDDHPYFVFEDGERVEQPAAQLEDGDWVYVPRRLPKGATDGGIAVTDTVSAVDDGPAPALGAVLGYLSGDGNVYYDREEGVYGIRFTNKEAELLADFERACREAFDAEPVRPPSEQRGDGVETVRLPGREYADAVLDAGMNLETYDGKAFPDGVTDASAATKAAFVRALADSEGTVDVATGNVKIYSSSYELLLGTKSLLLEFGVSTQIQVRERAEGRRDLYVLAITAADSLAAFDRHVGFTLGRKQAALESVCDSASGDRTIVDVIPDCGDLLTRTRESLRLYQSECGLVDTTYCNFENGDANLSLRCARTVLSAFEDRRREARADQKILSSDCDWAVLGRIKKRYHVSQAELAAGTGYSQQQVSSYWGEDGDLRPAVRHRLQEVVRGVAETDLTTLRDLVRGDVKWRRVTSVETVPANGDDDRVRLLRGTLADVLGCPENSAVEWADDLLASDPRVDSWDVLRVELDRHGVSFADVAADLGVAASTVSRWFGGVVETDRFEDVVEVALERIRSVRGRVRRLLDEIDARDGAKVYDLTVEGTHNFVANGMVVHNSEDRSAMHEALEQQTISISKAGINATLKSRCSLLGAANPKYGRFDRYEPMGEQIDLEPALISRFDLIFTVTDQPDPDRDTELAEHILMTNYAGELNTHRSNVATSNVSREEVEAVTSGVEPAIEADLLRKYIAYAKRNVYPTMTEAAREAIREFYVSLRSKGVDEDAPVPVTARQLEALVRLAEASARVRLSDVVTAEDANRVIEIVRACLQDIGVDPETGQYDADVVETGTSKTQRDRIKNIRALIAEIQEEYEEGAPIEEVLDRAEQMDTERSKAEHEIEKLKQKGEVYQPNTDHLRTT